MPQKNTKALKLYRADIAARAAAEAATDSDSGSESDSDYEEVPSHPRTTPMAENKLLLTVKLTRPTAKSETGAVTAAKPVTAAEPVTGAVATEAGAVAMETDAVATEAGAVAMETDAVATEAGAEAAAAEPAARGKKRRRPRPKMSSPAEAKQMLDTLGIQVRAELFKRSQELMFAAAAFSALETDQRKTEGFAERAQARAAKESRLAAEKAAKDAAKAAQKKIDDAAKDAAKAAQKKIDDAAKAAKKEMERVDKAKVESAVSQIKDLFERYNKAGEISLAASSKPFDEATIRGLEGELRFDRTTSNIDTVCTRMMQPKTNAGVRDAVSKAFEMTTAVGRLPECVDVRVPDKLVAAKAKLDAFQVEAANAKAARLVLAQAAAATAAEAAAKAKAQQAALDSAAKLAAALGPRAHEGEPLEELPL
jgi:hypothetical protein